MRLEVDMLIKTNYSGPYRIKKITRGCTCNGRAYGVPGQDEESRSHIHLELTKPDGTGRFYINRFNEETLLSLDKTYCGHKEELDYDRIIIMEQDKPVQGSLF